MKALSNGVLNCTISDGWAKEVSWEGKGWVLSPENTADHLYDLLESTIAPLYYHQNHEGIPEEWVSMMKNSIGESGRFSAHRMLEEYQSKLYRQE